MYCRGALEQFSLELHIILRQQISPQGANDDSDEAPDTECLVRAFAAALRSTKRDYSGASHNLHCDFWNRSGHTEDSCYFNSGNPNNKLTQKLRNMLTQSATGTAHVAVSAENKKNGQGKSRKIEFAGTMIEKTTIVLPKDGHLRRWWCNSALLLL